AECTIKGSTFFQNISASGGAILSQPQGVGETKKFVMDSCFIQDNIFEYFASFITPFAVVYLDLLPSINDKFMLNNCNFYCNKGWIEILSSAYPAEFTYMNKSDFIRNESGYIFNIYGNVVLIENSKIIKNSDPTQLGIPMTIGGILMNFNNNIFAGNTSFDIFFKSLTDTLNIENSIFSYNEIENINASSFKPNHLKIANSNLTNILRPHNFFDSNENTDISFCHLDSSVCNLPFSNNITCGPGNLFNLDPLFRDTANNDYSLLPCSPLLNAGSNAAAAGILTDIAGNPRIQEGTVDIGAYESAGFALAAAPMVAPACEGTSGGSISLQPVNGCEPYTYNWLPNAGTGAELNELPPGAYQLTLTDASGRQITDTILVPEAPRPDLSLLATDVNCGNPAGGSLSAVVSNGTGPFSYQWLPAAADTAVLKKLPAGAYALTLTDVNGCQDSATANIQLIGAITLAVGGQPIPCYGQTGWLSATPANGAPPFSWQWSGWSGTDSLAQPLTPGNYAVTVADAYGCTASFTYPPLTQPDSLYLGTGNTPQTQSNPPNGTALVTTISGGTSPFDYYWTTMEETQAITGLPAGTYTVTVSDKNGCTATAEVVVQFMVSTAESDQQAILLYPNPATDWVQLLLPAGKWQWALSDAGGKQLRSGVCESEQVRLDLSGLVSGAYILRAWNGQQTWVGRIVKR
ncbi:MAG TPA: hypothetical protein DCF33_18360, partial [Saprospirales bacterium]|nr:hypothetical protein [Saprospirales bacterium]